MITRDKITTILTREVRHDYGAVETVVDDPRITTAQQARDDYRAAHEVPGLYPLDSDTYPSDARLPGTLIYASPYGPRTFYAARRALEVVTRIAELEAQR